MRFRIYMILYNDHVSFFFSHFGFKITGHHLSLYDK